MFIRGQLYNMQMTNVERRKTGNFDDGHRKGKSSVRALLTEVTVLKKTTGVLGKVETRHLGEEKRFI